MRVSPITSYFAIDKVWVEKRGECFIKVEPVEQQLEADIRASFAEAPILDEAQVVARTESNPWYEYRDQGGTRMTVMCQRVNEQFEVPAAAPVNGSEPAPGFLDPPAPGAEAASADGEMTETTLAQVLATIMQQIAVLQQSVDILMNANGFVVARAFGYPVKPPPDELMGHLGIQINRTEPKRVVTLDSGIVRP